jgi:hypothetical protein
MDDSQNTLSILSQTDLHRKVSVSIDETISAVQWINHPDSSFV